jgi:hypothetical protein
MDKNRINRLLPIAVEVIEKELTEPIPNEFRGYIASFGAAITMGSLPAAVAYYSAKSKNAKEDRTKLPVMILEVLKKEENRAVTVNTLFEYVTSFENENESFAIKEDVLHAAIAIKLGLNLFEIESKDEKAKEDEKNGG